MTLKKVDTPCIGICSTVYGDDICRGCKRHYHEVIEWNTYSEQQKQIILHRLEGAIVNIVNGKLTVANKDCLQRQLDKFNLRYREKQHPLCWAYHLLREAHQNIRDITQYGIIIADQYTALSLSELYRLIDLELLEQAKQYFNQD